MDKAKRSEYNRRYRQKQKEKLLKQQEEPTESVEESSQLEVSEDDYKEFLKWKEGVATKKKESFNFLSLLPALIPPLIGIIQRATARDTQTSKMPSEASSPPSEDTGDKLASFFS